MMRNRKPRSRGLTLIEVAVVIAILGLLAAIALPAVQGAREASRRASCANHLRQLALATNSYVTSNGVYPSAIGLPNYGGADQRIRLRKEFSLFTHLMPYLDQVSVFSSINFEVGATDPYLEADTPTATGSESNRTVMGTNLSVLLCPTDSSVGGWTGNCSYRANLGSDRWHVSTNGPFMQIEHQLSPASVTDGLSNTVGFCEKLHGSRRTSGHDPRRDMYVGGLGLPFSAEESYQNCAANLDGTRGVFTNAGLTWFIGTLSQTCYNHVMPPNNTVPDCILPGAAPISGLLGARSDHPGGVNAAICDGSVRFISNRVNIKTWRSLGTRNGAEIVSQGDY